MKPVTVPRDSIYALQRSLKGVYLVASWAEEGASEKKPSKISDVAFHPVRPWLAAMDGAKGTGFVWNYDTNEIVREFSLDTGSDNSTAGDGAGADETIGTLPPPATLAFQAKNLLQKTASPTATPGSFVKATRGKASQMLFYDHEAIMATTLRNTTDRVCFEEWIIILTASNVFFCDVNQTTAVRLSSSSCHVSVMLLDIMDILLCLDAYNHMRRSAAPGAYEYRHTADWSVGDRLSGWQNSRLEPSNLEICGHHGYWIYQRLLLCLINMCVEH